YPVVLRSCWANFRMGSGTAPDRFGAIAIVPSDAAEQKAESAGAGRCAGRLSGALLAGSGHDEITLRSEREQACLRTTITGTEYAETASRAAARRPLRPGRLHRLCAFPRPPAPSDSPSARRSLDLSRPL